MAAPTKELVLVTGGSGFIGVWCIIKCLEAGYRVRTTIRSLKREREVRDMIAAGSSSSNFSASDISFAAADLLQDDGWAAAAADCTYVLHVASPFPASMPKHEDELVVPAREGTLRVLRAARSAGTVRRVVVTSSIAAIAYGAYAADKVYTEADWTPLGSEAGVLPYPKSKTAAERAAWDYVEAEAKSGGSSMELSVVNPGAVFGPVLGSDFSTSIQIVTRLLNANILELPACPRITFNGVDVRDVADLHLLAMTSPRAAGERFMAVVEPPVSIRDVSLILHRRMGKAARRAPKGELPDWLLKVASLWDPAIALVLPELGQVKHMNCNKAVDVLGWKPRSIEDAIVATAESLIKFGIAKG